LSTTAIQYIKAVPQFTFFRRIFRRIWMLPPHYCGRPPTTFRRCACVLLTAAAALHEFRPWFYPVSVASGPSFRLPFPPHTAGRRRSADCISVSFCPSPRSRHLLFEAFPYGFLYIKCVHLGKFGCQWLVKKRLA